MDICDMEELLRYRPSNPNCAECFDEAKRHLENIISRAWDTPSIDRTIKAAFTIRVSCESSLAGERTCPVMGAKGYKFLCFMERAAVIPIVIIESIKLRSGMK